MMRPGTMLAAMLVMLTAGATAHAKTEMRTFAVLAGAGAHDVYPAPDGAVWFTAQSAGKLGRLDPRTGKSDLIALGPGAAPHGVIVGPDGAAWVTEGGQNAIARVDPATRAVKLFPLPKERRAANLNTAAFDNQSVLWFTGQNGVYCRLDPKSGTMAVFDAPRGTGPYGITTTPEGRVFSLPWPATISVGSISRPVLSRSWSRPCRGKAHGASGATAAADCGLPVGTAEISSATTARTIVGSAGICRATGRSPTLSTSMTPMPCGSATGEQTRSCASIPKPRSSKPFLYPTATPACGSLLVAKARFGGPNPRPTNSS